MRASFAFVLIPLLAVLGCDFTGGPDKVQRETETQLRQYFPNSRVMVFPKQETILAFTCAYGLGRPLIEELVKTLENKRGIQHLHEARQLPLKLSPYRFFVLAFDEYSIRLDTDQNQHWILSSDSKARLEYETACANDTGVYRR